jgi:hypothetical protein
MRVYIIDTKVDGLRVFEVFTSLEQAEEFCKDLSIFPEGNITTKQLHWKYTPINLRIMKAIYGQVGTMSLKEVRDALKPHKFLEDAVLDPKLNYFIKDAIKEILSWKKEFNS